LIFFDEPIKASALPGKHLLHKLAVALFHKLGHSRGGRGWGIYESRMNADKPL